MNGIFWKIISIAIILVVIGINLRTITGFITWKGGKHNTEEGVSHQTHRIEENIHYWKEEISPPKFELPHCSEKRKEESVSGSKIILRLDGINARTKIHILERFIEDAKKVDAPLVLGITPEHLENNTELFRYLIRETCHFEVAIHWWDHFSATTSVPEKQFITEFSGIGINDMMLRINRARGVLSKITHAPIITLTPPFHIISASGILAAQKSGIAVVSSVGSWVFDAPNTSNNLESGSGFIKENIIDTCKSPLKNYNICVILMHPFQFTDEGWTEIDEKAYQEYLSLLKYFSENGSDFTTFWALRQTWPKFFQYSLIR